MLEKLDQKVFLVSLRPPAPGAVEGPAFCPALLVASLLVAVFFGSPLFAQADVYMKDTPADTGVEPNPNTGPMWVTEDIWVRRSPDPGYQATPFPEASPSWTPLPHQDPEYRDPIFSVPNYVYVRVRNRGNVASTGNEVLKLYWAKASTGLAWDSQWVDYLDSTCGPTQLYGAEITKPRKNAATATAAERDAYRDAILDIGTLPGFVFTGGTSYWHKQDEVHQSGPSNRHTTPAFLPWHREFINRYEVLLQKADPTVKLLYWDWTTDPENSNGGFDFFTSSFMGASGRGSATPVPIGAPFSPALAPPSVSRRLRNSTTPPADPDSSLLANPSYELFADDNESEPNHNSSHGYIGGPRPNNGNMSVVETAAEDPFFFVLHANVDRLWAEWQRDPSNLSRLENATAYDGDSSNANITTAMGPWDGIGGAAIQPWTSSGGHIVSKTPKDSSVVSPPVYDTAPVVVPALDPGEAVVVQIPWYPPDPADYSCFGPTEFDHFCLLARIETSPGSPFGMTFAEGTAVHDNTRNNNNIVWKNIAIVDDFAGPLGRVGFFVRNVHAELVFTDLLITEVDDGARPFLETGRIFVDLPADLFELWEESGGEAENLELVDPERFTFEILSAGAVLRNIPLGANATYPISLGFELGDGYQPAAGEIPRWDIVQLGSPGNPQEIVGGNRYELDLSSLKLIPESSDWKFWDRGMDPGGNWTSIGYDDSAWRSGKASLGFGERLETTVDGGPEGARYTATYFRHTFEVQEPNFYNDLMLRLRRDDGAVVYLNGTEVHRVHIPTGVPSYGTVATRDVDGLEEEQYFPISISNQLQLLQTGPNVVAVEIHQVDSESEDLSFDLELSANNLSDRFPPDLRFVSPLVDVLQIGHEVTVTIEASDPDPQGSVDDVTLTVNRKVAGQSGTAPHTFEWTPKTLGMHRLRATATDGDGQSSSADLTVSVVANAPPTVTLLEPADESMFGAGKRILLSADADDVSGGSVVRVEFFVLNMDEIFTASPTRVGVATCAPFTGQVRLHEEGHYMIWAVAIDDGGAVSQSYPAHVHIGSPH